MTDITCISPIDGTEVARRAIASDAEIAAALAAAVPTALVGFTDFAMVLLLSALALGILSIGD